MLQADKGRINAELRTDAPGNQMSPRRIDFHVHLIPPFYRHTIKVLNAIGLSDPDKEKICHGNAQLLFGLK